MEPDEYEQFSVVEVSDDASAEEAAELISEQFHDPRTTAVVAEFEDDVAEFDASDIGSIQAMDGAVHGMIRESPPVETLENLRVRSKPWLTSRVEPLLGVGEGDTLVLGYDSRFGKTVEREITVTEAGIERSPKPYGFETEQIEGNVDLVAVFGFRDGDEYGVMLQANGGVNVLMNDTRIIEPGTVPSFGVNNDDSK